MSQYDFGTIDPNTKSGTALATDLNSWRNALHTTHGGSSAPSYITAGMLWLDTTSANYKLKLYDGAQSIDVGIIDATNNVTRVAVDSAATSYITATTAAQIKFVIASVDTATVRSTGLQFNIASPYIGDSSNNELISFTTTASAVNQINITNAATLTNPVISAVGNDVNIGITLTPKGTGRTNIGQLALDGTTITTTAAQLNFVTGVTSAIQTQIDGKAPLASPALTGTPTAPTATAGTNTTQLATTAFVLANTGGMTLLGTLTTTSGSSQSLTGLTLTDYKQLVLEFNGVSHSSATSSSYSLGSGTITLPVNLNSLTYGIIWVSLITGIATAVLSTGGSLPRAAGDGYNSFTGYSTATTTVTLSVSNPSFDAGSVKVYGVK